jgi:hypothetical protein
MRWDSTVITGVGSEDAALYHQYHRRFHFHPMIFIGLTTALSRFLIHDAM